ncbi:MAG: hypothetical protein EVB11_12245 [Winogradskyella sp.]|nr:MAG: hypothetical protein EVB11_12245 [Winogradskyella sp.]
MKNKYNCISHRIKKSLYLLLVVIALPITAIAQNCNAELSVYKNRPYKSLDVSRTNKTIYKLKLTNTSSQKQTYSISTSQPDINCSNNTLKKRIGEDNAKLLVSFSQSINKKTLYPGQEFEFSVTVAAPKNSEIRKWGCVEVLVKTDNCSTVTSKVLSTYITKGEND